MILHNRFHGASCIVGCTVLFLIALHSHRYLHTYKMALHGRSESHLLPGWCYGPYRYIVADWEWCQLLCTTTFREPEDFYHIVDAITGLDEHANGIFRSAANMLAVHMRRPDLAVAVLQKSLRSPVNNDDWRIYHVLAYLHCYALNNRQSALFYLETMIALTRTSDAVLKQFRPKRPTYCYQWATRLRKEIKYDRFVE